MTDKTLQLICDNIAVGRENATSSKQLQQISGLSERELRKAIEQLRRSECVILSNSKGYFFPENQAELRSFVKQEKSRALSILRTLKPAKKRLKEWELASEFEGNIYTGDIHNG